MKFARLASVFFSSVYVTLATDSPAMTPAPSGTFAPSSLPTVSVPPTVTSPPSSQPSPAPSSGPSVSSRPTPKPTVVPSPEPSSIPTPEPTVSPAPTSQPTPGPSTSPTSNPTPVPTLVPSLAPTHIPSSSPTPQPSLPTPIPFSQPTSSPSALPTARPSHVPTPQPSRTPPPSVTYDPTGLPTFAPTPRPSHRPSNLPTRHPSQVPTPTPTDSSKPTGSPTLSPTPLPTPSPTTLADFYPIYHVTALVHCLRPLGAQSVGATNHTYGLSLKSQVATDTTTPLEYQTDATKAVFRGLGRVDSQGHPVDYDAYNYTDGDRSCAVDQGGGAGQLALIHDFPIGSAEYLQFKDQNGDGLDTDPDASYDITQVCLEQFTSGQMPEGHVGVEVDFIVQRFDVRGTTTFVTNVTLDMYQQNAGTDDPTDPGERCVFMHPLAYEMNMGGFTNRSMLVQNALPWEMTLYAEFDAEISLLAFPWDDDTDRSERAALTMQHGEYLVANLDVDAYPRSNGYTDAFFENPTQGRKLQGYALATAYNSSAKDDASKTMEICDSACLARGGEYKSWQPHIVIQWNVTKSSGNVHSMWGDVLDSTWGRPLKIRDEHRYFAVSYDRTPPTAVIVGDSVKFTYAGNVTKCGNSQWLNDPGTNNPERSTFASSFPYYQTPDDVPQRVAQLPDCLPTSIKDTLEFNFTANEEGIYYFYAHPSFDQEGMEANFSGLLGKKWPYSIKDTGLYSSITLCDTNSSWGTSCDSFGSFPRDERIEVPMDPEAFIFGYDFSFSEFAVYTFAEDDGYTSEHEGFYPGNAQGLRQFQTVYGNLSYPLLAPNFVHKLMTDDDPDSATPEDTIAAQLTDRANYYNESDWSATRFILNSARDSNLSKVVELTVDDYNAYTTEFGRGAKVHMKVAKLADEFDYTSHRSKFYRGRLHQKFEAVGTTGSYTKTQLTDIARTEKVYRSDLRSFFTNTKSMSAYQRRIGRGQDELELYQPTGGDDDGDNPFIRLGYRITRGNSSLPENQLQTVFVMDSSDKSEAVASSDPSGRGQAAMIMGLNLTTGVSNPYFYMIGQNDGVADGDKMLYAQLRLLYSNDPLFQFVPVDTVTQVPIWNFDYASILPDSSAAMDDTGYVPATSLPVLNVTAKDNVDYTTDVGGLCTLLVSLTEQPTGWVKVNVGVPDKSQAQLYQGKNPVLLFSPATYQNLEVTIEGLDDHDNSNGDVPFDVVFSLQDTHDPRLVNRYDAFNFATTLTNLATKDDVRLAIGFNRTFCQTSETGSWCDIPLQVCAYNAYGDDGSSNRAVNCNDDTSTALSGAPFSKLPIFTTGVDRVVVHLNVSDRFESEIVSVTGNGRFDASGSAVNCVSGARGGHGNLEGGCVATVVFEPFSNDDDKARSWQGDGQGPYIAYVRLQGVDDFVVDGLANNVLSITSASVVKGREATQDFVLYQDSQLVKNVDDDTSASVRWLSSRGDAYASTRFLEVTPSSCFTSEDADVGACPVTVSASFELLNNSVTTEHDTVECAKVTFDLTWYFDNTTSPQDAVALLTSQITRPTLFAGVANDYYRVPAYLQVSDNYTIDGDKPYSLEGWVVSDIKSYPGKLPTNWEGRSFDADEPNMAYRAREDFCLAPGNFTGSLSNVTSLYEAGLRDSPGGWVASISVTGTDTLLWTSLGYPNKPNEDQIGNFSYEVPKVGIPIVLQGQAATSLQVEVTVASSSAGSLNVSGLSASASAKRATAGGAGMDQLMTWNCSSSCSVSFNLNSDDDDVDDDDEEYSVTATVRNVELPTPSRGESVVKISSWSQYTVVPVTHFDDDTAGLLLQALDSVPLKAYRTELLLPSDDTNQGHRFFGMAYNTTREGYRLDAEGDPQRSNETWFNVSLTSQPRHDVVVKVTANPVHNEWGWQFEGVPTEGYVVKSYESPSMWVTGTNDSVVDPWNSGLYLTFTPSNWAEPQTVGVMGLDDFLDDGDRDYTFTLTAASDDLYYDSGSSSNASWSNLTKLQQEQYPRTSAYMPVVTVPLRNLDDDSSGFVALQNGTRCSEPYYGLDAAVQMYLTSKPANVVSVYLQSSDPLEAGPTQELVAFTPDNWEYMKEVPVKSVDDFAADGNVNFTVTVDLLHSFDAVYSDTSMYGGSFDFVSMDDPNDGLGMGASVEVSVSSDNDYTTALGGALTLDVSLSYMPQAPVYIGATTSNQDQAVVSSSSTLVFTAENYAVAQAVTVTGVDDSARDGDTMYQAILGLEATDDPYYARFAFGPKDKTVVHNVVSQDYPYARVRLALSTDTTTTKEDDAAMGTYTALTVGLCEAIYAPVELGGVAGTQAGEMTVGSTSYGTSDDLCSGYWLDSDELFGSADSPAVSFVAATVQVSDVSEAVLACAPNATAANGCDVSYNGKTATLVFDLDAYPDLSNFSPQLWVVGVDDFEDDGDVAFEVSVPQASVKYFKETHAVGSGYLPDPLSLVNQDDDLSAFERNAWYTVSPAVGCSVFEDPAAQMHDNCVLNVSFTDAMKRPLGGERFVFKIDVDVSQLGSSVYIDSVPSISQGLHWNSTCELGTEGCTTLSLSFLEGENTFNPKDVPFKKLYLLDNPDDPHIRFGNMSAQIALATVNNFWDDGDEAFQVVADGLVGYNCSNGTLFLGCGTYVDSGNLTYTVDGTQYDDDTAGVVVTQEASAFEAWAANSTFKVLRTGRDDGTDDGSTSLRTVALPHNTTSEAGRESVGFWVALTSAPSEAVTVTFTAQFLTDEWGVDRVEGVPTFNGSKTSGGGYKVAEYKSAADFLNKTGSKDYVTNPDTGRLLLTFYPWDWNVSQYVEVAGLDDLAADGDVEYNVYAAVNGTEGDLYRYAPSEGGFDEPARFPLVNLDDEQQTAGWWVQQYGDLVAEPYYGYVARIEMHPLTEPSDVILLSFSSTKPWIANTSETLVAISPSDWDQTKTVYVTAVDNFEDDGNIGFEVEMLMLGSSDQMYGALIQNTTFSFTKVDDPNDATYDLGVGMEFAIGKNLYGVEQAFTTEYGGDGMMLDDDAKTGTATVQARLTLEPQDDVTYTVSVSDTSEAQVLYPSTVVFTPDNWDQYQEVVVIGRSDSVADGDVEYDVEFNLLGTNDPYYRVLSPNATKYGLINQDTIEQRVALGISSLGCYNITEGTSFSRGYQIGGDATCTVTLSLCLSDTDGCTQKLSAQEVYNTSESLGVDSISIWGSMGDRRVARIAQPEASHVGQVNVSANGTQVHATLAIGQPLETAFNLTVYATDDSKDEFKKLSTELSFYGVLRKGGSDLQEFVNYYDDFGDVTEVGAFGGRGGSSFSGVRMGSVPVHTRDDETPRLVFYKTTPGCNTGEDGRVDTPGLQVSDGTCVMYLRLGSKPSLESGQAVQVSLASSDASAGLFALSYDADLTDSVDLTDTYALPTAFTDSFKLNFTADTWDTPVKVVLVGQDDTVVKGNVYYELSATVSSSAPDADFAGQSVVLSFWNQEDDTASVNVTQGAGAAAVGARTALGVDEAGWVAGACRAFTVVAADSLWVVNAGNGANVSATVTLTSSDATEGLVGLQCDPTLSDNYAESVTAKANSTGASMYSSSELGSRGGGAVFYYIGVDDDDNDGDVEFSITVDVDRPAYKVGNETVAAVSASYTFYVTNYDDDSLVLSNPDVEGEREFKLTVTDANASEYKLQLLEPSECPSAGGCADECADAQPSEDLYETISCSEKVDASDQSKPSNRTGKLSFSYPNAATWNNTDFTKVQVNFDFTSNVGRYQLDFAAKGDTIGANPDFTNCSSAVMQDYDDQRSRSCWVTFDSPDTSFYMYVTALADDVDRGDFVESYIDITTQMFYQSASDSSASFASSQALAVDRPAQRSYDGSVYAKGARSQRVLLSLVEDDLAGFALNQTKANSAGEGLVAYAYRNGSRNELMQDSTATISSVALPFATTKESGGNVTFSVALTSQPLVGASVYVWAEQVARSDGSETRYEGIPWPSSYTWTKYHPPSTSDWAKLQAEDVVELKDWDEANKQLAFTTTNWAEPQEVTIVGLNDFYDDSSVAYTIYLTTVSDSASLDPYYDDVGQVEVPLTNEDDDVAGLGAYWDDYSTGPVYGIVSEPYYGYEASLYFYLKSKPTDTVLVTLVSSAPSEAQSSVSVAAIGPSDWDVPRETVVTGVDDRVLDGAQNFTVTVSVVYSDDSDYGTSDANEDGVTGRMSLAMDGYSLDDPTDVSATTCGLGEFGRFGNPTSNCSSCIAGTYAEVAGDKVACRMCPPGTFGSYQGSQALTAATDYDDTYLPPGCMPCPNGTYSTTWGAKQCLPCPDGKYCWPLATVTPKDSLAWTTYASSFEREWSQVSAETFKASVKTLPGDDREMNRDQYEAYLVVCALVVWLIVAVLALAAYFLLSNRWRLSVYRFFRFFDLFPRSHEEQAKSEEQVGDDHAPSALGGVVSFGVLSLGAVTTVILCYVYANFNVVATSNLDVYNSTFVDNVKVDLTAQVTFVGFSGCDDATFLPTSAGESTVPGMVATGVTYESRSSSYECSGGDLAMTLVLGGMKVSTNPKLAFSVAPSCGDCAEASPAVSPLYAGNTVLSCPSCTVASAQAFSYSVRATNVHNEAPGLHDKDDNTVSGTEVPSTKTECFRGSDATEVKVNLMPSDYDNRRTAKKFRSYRLVYAETELGSTQQFQGATDFYGEGASASDPTAPTNFETWVKEDSWVEEGAVNEVKFTLDMPLASSRVSVVVGNAKTFLDLWAQVGGVLGLLVALFLLAMNYLERAHDRKDPIGAVWHEVLNWVYKQRKEWHEKWHPEPESWTMKNINRMQRREEKREGGARKVEDGALSNFKDLYTRNAVTAGFSGRDVEEHVDEDDVDTGVF